MIACDIKFVNKEITPFGGLSMFFKMLEKCRFDEHLQQSGIPVQGSNMGYKPLQLILGLFAGVWCGASCFGHLDGYVMTRRSVSCWGGNAGRITGLTNDISTNLLKPSTSVCSATCSTVFFLS